MTITENLNLMDLPDLSEFYTDSGLNDSSLPADSIEPLLEQTTHRLDDYYHNLESIGQGGMKHIYSALDVRSSRNVAIAILQSSDHTSQLEINSFIQEARIAANLEHPNIIPIYEIGVTADQKPFFSMKILEGVTLAEILKNLKEKNADYQKKYTADTLLQIFIDVCNAMAFAHSKKVIHLDLKPENIQVGEFGEVLVLDWGLAKILDEDEDLETQDIRSSINIRLDYETSQNSLMTRHGIVKGSPGYMAPEQAIGGPESQKSFQTDVYALGAILYSILTYERPSVATTYAQILTETVSGSLVPPRKRTPQNKIPTALNAVTIKAMNKQIDDRYPTVEALTAEVKSYQNGYATLAESASMFTHLALFYKRHRLKALLAFASILLIITTVSLFLKQLGEERDTAQLALKEFRQAQIELATINDSIEKERARDWKLISRNSFTSKNSPLNWKLQTGLKVNKNYLLVKTQDPTLSMGKLNISKPEFHGVRNLKFKKPLTDKLRIELEMKLTDSKNALVVFYFRAIDSKNKIQPQHRSGYSFVYDLKRNAVSAYQFSKKLEIAYLNSPIEEGKTVKVVCQITVKEMSFWLNNELIIKTKIHPLLSLESTANNNGIAFIDTNAEIDNLTLYKLGSSDLIDLINLAKKYLNEGDLQKAKSYFSEVKQNSASIERIKVATKWIHKIEELEKLTKTMELYQDIAKNIIPGWDSSMLRLVNERIHLSIENSKIENISFMKKFPDISGFLNLANTKVKLLSPIKRFSIKTLILTRSEVKTLIAIREAKIENIIMNHTGITSLKGIDTIKGLDFLDLRNTKLKDISQLKKTRITRLMLTPKLMPKGWEEEIKAMPNLKFVSTTILEDLNQQITTQFFKKLNNGVYDNK